MQYTCKSALSIPWAWWYLSKVMLPSATQQAFCEENSYNPHKIFRYIFLTVPKSFVPHYWEHWFVEWSRNRWLWEVFCGWSITFSSIQWPLKQYCNLPPSLRSDSVMMLPFPSDFLWSWSFFQIFSGILPNILCSLFTALLAFRASALHRSNREFHFSCSVCLHFPSDCMPLVIFRDLQALPSHKLVYRIKGLMGVYQYLTACRATIDHQDYHF